MTFLFGPLGHCAHAQTARHRHHRADDGRVLLIAVNLGNETLVNFQAVNRQAAQLAER